MEKIFELKEFYEADRANDAVLLQLINAILEQVSSKVLTDEKGSQYLFYDPTEDMLNRAKQKSMVCLCLYYTLIYVLTTLYIGFIHTIDNTPHKLPVELLGFLHSLKDRCTEILEISIKSLDNLLPCLNDKYAQIYHQEKVWFFEKDIYGCKGKLEMPSQMPKNSKPIN
jgi:hypothetical protein